MRKGWYDIKDYIILAAGAAVLILISVLVLKYAAKAKVYLFSGVLGIAALCVTNLLSPYTGLYLGYNVLSVVSSFVLGIPAVVMQIILRII